MQVIFHFVAKRLDEDATLLDDSRKWSKPMEIILGKKFKLESWETSLSTMRIGEVASFTTKRVYTHSYPLVAKTLRDNYLPKKEGHDHKKHEHKAHMCGMMAMQAEGGLGVWLPSIKILVVYVACVMDKVLAYKESCKPCVCPFI